MVAFVIVVRDILTDRASQVALAERDHSMQTLELDGPHEPFCPNMDRASGLRG